MKADVDIVRCPDNRFRQARPAARAENGFCPPECFEDLFVPPAGVAAALPER